MSRLTQCFEVGNYVEKKAVCIIPKNLGQVFDDDIVMGKAVDKLAELEDVLEEFGIESVQELKARLQSESQLANAGYKLALENEDLTKQLSKSIVPKFKKGDIVYATYSEAELKKALELACNILVKSDCEFCKYKDDEECPPNHTCRDGTVEYFINKAKEMLEDDKTNS